MAKNEADSKAQKAIAKAEKAEKAEKAAKAAKAAKTEKAKKGGLKKYLKDLRSEIKKVVWPSRKQVTNNTGIVMTVMAVMGLFLFAIDTGLAAVIKALLSIGS
ncbi:MAG: preprotein translocase subunit SecE [Ruminococcus sp.]|nr:preprotein translocase subunit SecE [Ruminococcus sp.]